MRFRFGDYCLDTAQRELYLGVERISVEPQVFDLLEFAIRHRDRVVSKDDLLASIWQGRIVSELTLTNRINAARKAIGDNGTQQRWIRTVSRRGIRFVGEVRQDTSELRHSDATETLRAAATTRAAQASPPQDVTFCRAWDGVKLAIATSGDGLPLVTVGTWLRHVEHDWQCPMYAPLFAHLANRFRLVRYDPRGCGLSERNVAEISFEAFVRDLESVVESLGLRRFALSGASQGAAVAIVYAARHPDRVTRLVITGGRAVSWRKLGDAADTARHEALMTLIRHGWGQDNPAFRQVFTSRNWPDATVEEMRSLNELQRISSSPETALRIRQAYSDFDLRDVLPRLKAPTLVLHSRYDAGVPLELGLTLASEIPNARMVELDSRSHFPLPREPAWARYVDAICAFLDETKGKARLKLVAP